MRPFVVLAVIVAGCGGRRGAPTVANGAPPTAVPASATTPPNPLVRTDLHCTMATADDERACNERGAAYSLQYPLHCYGTNPGSAVMEEHRIAYEASSEPCACISPVEIEECSKVN